VKKVKKILVTAPIQEINSKLKNSIISLADPYNNFYLKNYYQNKKILCSNYHWNSKKKFRRDTKYIIKVYEIYLKKITIKLNQIHNTNHSIYYWRIIIGPWLFDFITILFDRLEILKFFEKRYKITEVRSAFYKKEDIIFNDYQEFYDFIWRKDDQFNNIIFSELVKYHSKISIKQIVLFRKKKNISDTRIGVILAMNILKIYNFFSKFFRKSTDIFIIDSYFKNFFNLKLQIAVGQFPNFWGKVMLRTKKTKRKTKMLFEEKNNNEFFDVLNYFISNFIPKIYLENYKEAVKLSNNLPWPKKPKAIISSIAYFLDDVFKIWAAEKKIRGSNLISTQHGGSFFSTRVHSQEMHLKKISDYILTWGDKSKKNKFIIPLFNFLSTNKKIQSFKFGNLLLVDYIMPKYVEGLFSVYKGPQNLLFLEKKIKFLKNLKNRIINKTFIRNKDQYFDTLSFERGMYADLNINVNFSSKGFYKELQNSRICVSNSNQTVFLETLNLNFPTIIYFDSRFDELKKTVTPYYNILKDSKIFFEDSVKAAIHINDIWDNVDDWWQSKKVQNAVNLFCDKFSKRATSFKLHRFLNELDFKKSDVQSGEII
jgi:putative transferase (TIGR04331 family)